MITPTLWAVRIIPSKITQALGAVTGPAQGLEVLSPWRPRGPRRPDTVEGPFSVSYPVMTGALLEEVFELSPSGRFRFSR